jgi:hypothetical protein
MRSQANDVAALMAIVVGTIAFLVTGAAVAHGESIDVQLENKTYALEYSIAGGGLIESAMAESHQPYGGALTLSLAPSLTVTRSLEITLPREFFDRVGFTDHYVNFGLTALAGENELFAETISDSCDEIVMRVPLELGFRQLLSGHGTEEVVLGTIDILQVHDHPYPPALNVRKNVTIGDQQYDVYLRTDAARCDVSFWEEETRLHIGIEGRNETSKGYFSIVVPRGLLGGNYAVFVDGQQVDFRQNLPNEALGIYPENITATHVELSLSYPTDASFIDIIAVDAPTHEGWKTAYVVGKFLNSEPPKPDQIFRIEYRVINGTVESFDMQQKIEDVIMGTTIVAKVDSSSNGVLEVKFPRNFPYSNSESGIERFLAFTGNTEVQDNRTTDECFFVFSLPFTDNSSIEIATESILTKAPYHGDDIPDSCASQTTKDAPIRQDGTISPLHQFRAGVAAEDIMCKEGLDLVISPNGKPYCAKPDTAKMLAERWN